MSEHTYGKPAGAFISLIHQLLSEVTLELSSSEKDDDAINERLQLMADAIVDLAPDGQNWHGNTKIQVGDGMVFEAEVILRLRPQRDDEFKS